MARDEAELITLKEAAKICGLSAAHLRRLAGAGKIWAKKMGPIWVTTAEAVLQYKAQDLRPGPKKRH